MLDCAGVAGALAVVEPADVADSYSPLVPAQGMGAFAVVGTALFDGPVEADDVVVPDAVESALAARRA